MTALAELQTLPEGVSETSELISRFDEALHHGFARLAETQRESLAAYASAFQGSPLEEPISSAVEAIARSEFLPRHFLALAAGRVALQGAQYDALMEQLYQALGRERIEIEPPTPISSGEASSMLAGTQQWLMEIASAGFANLVEDSVAPFMATLEHLQNDPRLTPLAAMTTGFVTELLEHMPAERQPELPVFRWADLWAGVMMRTQHLPGHGASETVSGIVIILGVDVRSHRNFVNAILYGLLRQGDSVKTVRIPFARYKVDMISGPDIWELFGDSGETVLMALMTHQQIKVANAELTPHGDLLLLQAPNSAKPCDPFTLIEYMEFFPAVPPLQRHPVQIAELVHVKADQALPIDRTRLPDKTALTPAVMKSAKEIIGLVRFDSGQWRLQPLAVRSAKTTTIGGQEFAVARNKRKSKTLAVLTERAGKLLRGK